MIAVTASHSLFAQQADELSPDMTFFEYLGTVVEDRGELLDPMDVFENVDEKRADALLTKQLANNAAGGDPHKDPNEASEPAKGATP